jgi:hypothetical protein
MSLTCLTNFLWHSAKADDFDKFMGINVRSQQKYAHFYRLNRHTGEMQYCDQLYTAPHKFQCKNLYVSTVSDSGVARFDITLNADGIGILRVDRVTGHLLYCDVGYCWPEIQ